MLGRCCLSKPADLDANKPKYFSSYTFVLLYFNCLSIIVTGFGQGMCFVLFDHVVPSGADTRM